MATQMSPFYASSGLHPPTTWSLDMESKDPASRNYARWIKSVHDLYIKHLKETRQYMGKYNNRATKEPPPHQQNWK